MPPTSNLGVIGDVAVQDRSGSGCRPDCQQMRDTVERVPRHVEAQHLAFECELVLVLHSSSGTLMCENRVGASVVTPLPN